MATYNPIPPDSEYSIMIPWVDINTTENYIRTIFGLLNWGSILKVDIVYKAAKNKYYYKGEHYKVFIHFNNIISKPVFEHLTSGGELKITHVAGYWMVLKNQWENYKKTQKPLQTTISSHPSMYSVLFEDSVESESQIDTACDSYCSACEELERGTGGENQMAHMEPGGCLYNGIMED